MQRTDVMMESEISQGRKRERESAQFDSSNACLDVMCCMTENKKGEK